MMLKLILRGFLCLLLLPGLALAAASDGITVLVGRAKIVRLPAAADRVAVGNPGIADYSVINNRELYVLGKAVGSTNIIYWNKAGASSTLTLNVTIDVDPLRQTLRQVLPREKEIVITGAANSVVLSGSVSNTIAAEAAYNLADAFARNLPRASGQVSGAAAATGASGSAAAPVFGMQVINLLKIRDAQQVMLEVRVAEVSKDLLEKIGVNFLGGTALKQSEFGGASSFRWSLDSGNGSLVAWLLGRTTGLGIDLSKSDTLVKILAAPTIVAVSGQEGTFLVGGKAFLPVQQGSAGNSAIALQEQNFGVGLKFVPTVLDNGRISLKVSPEVSELTNKTITSSTSASNAATFPVFVTRQASTTVQLQNGQSLVIGGLLSNNLTEVINSVPVLGQLPYLGALFRSSQFIENKSELIIVVRPVLVEALAGEPELPTDNFIAPSRGEFFRQGRMEAPYPSAASAGESGDAPAPQGAEGGKP